jgi:hypothetical protein
LNDVTLSFKSEEPFEIYGISLQSDDGVVMDNIPMRGCSGTIFTSIDKETVSPMYRDADVKMIILQFGGNMMPSIKNEKDAEWYGGVFKKQIEHLKTLYPDAVFLVIGPSDMSRKIRNEMVTWPHLPDVVKEFKKASNEAGAIFWSIFDAMGGENSMPVWVESKPSLASPDYIHFTRLGAERVAQMFYESLIQEYNEYRYLKEKEELRKKMEKEVFEMLNAKDTIASNE